MSRNASNSQRIAGFTLVEVMMAAVILTVGFVALIEAVTICSNRMDQARRQTLATQILTHEIESLRFKSWTEIQSLTNTTETSIDSTNYPNSPFLDTIGTVGATFKLSRSVAYIDPTTNLATGTDMGLREVVFTVSWEVRSSRHDASGNPLTFKFTRTNSAYYGKYGLNLTYQRS